jgi:hypothetical protein
MLIGIVHSKHFIKPFVPLFSTLAKHLKRGRHAKRTFPRHTERVDKADGTDAAYCCFVALTTIVRAGRAHQLVRCARSDSAQAQDALQIAATRGRATSNSVGSGADH